MSLSVVIPVFNGASTISQQIEAVLAGMDKSMELVVVDNRSTDDTAVIVERFTRSDPRVRLVVAHEKEGEPYARNIGVMNARFQRIAFCDADDIVGIGWSSEMLRVLEASGYATGPVDVERLNPPWLAGFRGREMFSTIPQTLGGIPFAHGCNFGIQKKTFETVGGFDEDFLIGCDVEFAIRVHNAGIKLDWVPDAIVYYRHRSSNRDRLRQAMSFGRAQHKLRKLRSDKDPLRRRLYRQRRRILWLVRKSVFICDRSIRASWIWTLGLVFGEVIG